MCSRCRWSGIGILIKGQAGPGMGVRVGAWVVVRSSGGGGVIIVSIIHRVL